MEAENTCEMLPVLPLRDVVAFPPMVMPLFVGRPQSVAALNEAMRNNKKIILVAQKEAENEKVNPETDLYTVGTLANIIQLLRLPDGTLKVLVDCLTRVKIEQFEKNENFLNAQFSPLESQLGAKKELDVAKSTALAEFEKYLKTNSKIQPDVLNMLRQIENVDQFADSMAAHLLVAVRHKQQALELLDVQQRLEFLIGLMISEAEILQTENRIRSRVKENMEKNQRNYYLSEQMKAIRKEMNDDNPEDTIDEVSELLKKVESAGMPQEVRSKVESELKKLKLMSATSSEAGVIRAYVEWMLDIPWHQRSKVKKDLVKAQSVLDAEHYGLERVKERIVEYLAVQARLNKIKGPILCLVGPPGVGKTSLGQSIANATGRKYVRMALGGVRDEAEIRGHRKTYVGALPGKLMQKMAKVGVKNPLFLLDEIDKMSTDMRGDPASALLEVLDPEQNSAFNDHYLEVDYDLSDVMFVATSNSMNIPAPLLDRMEVIRLSGYTEDEKLNIATQHLLKKQIERNGLKKGELTVEDSAILEIIRYYTREAGVRNLEREISKICRKAVKNLLTNPKQKSLVVNSDNLHDYLGVRRFEFGKADTENRIGEVTGLAWTEVGGDLLTIETASVLGKGKLTFTGSLGDVMKESIQAAMTVVRARTEQLGIATDFHEKRDLHIHVPDGATPKDGPSAGIAMCTALVSCLTGNPVRADVAMTGEIS